MRIDIYASYVVVVTGDPNDDDFITERTKVSGAELVTLIELFGRLSKGSRNWDINGAGEGEICTQHDLTPKQFSQLDRLMPMLDGEFPIHTLEGITVEPCSPTLWTW